MRPESPRGTRHLHPFPSPRPRPHASPHRSSPTACGLPCTYLVSSATFLTKRDVLGGRRYRDMTPALSLRRDTNGLSKPSAASAPDPPQTHTHAHTHSHRAPLQRPPLLARLHSCSPIPSPPTWAPRRDLQRFFPARLLGVRLRTRAARVRAAASVSFIGFLSYLLPLASSPLFLSLRLYFPAFSCLGSLSPLLHPAQVRKQMF